MKSIHLAAILAALISALTGCASMSVSTTEPLLSAAGFRIHAPKNEEQQRLYNDLPAYKVQRGTHKGEIFYAYKNEKEGVAYIGDEAAYQRYQALAVQRSIAAAQTNAAMMNDMAAMRWYRGYHYPCWY